MKLISCYIENFGGLSGCSLDFEAGLTVLCRPNGFGKTTLAEFIRVMFYGFPRKPRTGLWKKEKYQPWNGGKYGGHLTFEHEGRRYRIERSFGARETFSLIDLETGKKSAAFTKNIGLELFGLDAESFERSTYLPQERQTGAVATDSIRAKLAGLVEDAGDVGNYQKAQDALDKKRKFYAHRIGSGGAVAEDIRQISDIQTSLSQARRSRETLAGTMERIEALTEEQDRLNGELTDLRVRITAASETAARRAYRRQHDALTEARSAALQDQKELLERFPGGVPTAAECADAAAALEELATLENRQLETAADTAAQRFTAENARRFGSGVPAEGDCDAIGALCARRAGAAAELAGCAMPDADALEEAERFLAPGIPAAEVLAGHQAALEEARALRRQNLELAAAPAEQTRQKNSPAVPGALILGLLLAAVGIVMLSAGNFAPGGVLLGLGLLALMAAAWLSLRSAAQAAPGLSAGIQALIRSNEERAKALEQDVRRFTAVYYPGDPARALELIRTRMDTLRELTEAGERIREKRDALKTEIAACDEALKSFFLGWGLACSGDPRDLLEQLRRDCGRWEDAQRQLADLNSRRQDHEAAENRVRQRLDAFCGRFGIRLYSRQEAEELRSAVWALEGLEKDLEDLDRQLADYRREHGNVLDLPAEGEDPAVLTEQERQLIGRLEKITEQLPALRQEAQTLRSEAEAVPELEDSLVFWQEKKAADEKCAALLDDAKAFLAQAREDLATAYMGPIRCSFAALMERMMHESGDRIRVTEELEVYLERDGESRALACFSAGESDLVRLCMRLALVDALFRETKPFVILDDPFVNLDDDRTAEALALLQDLSRDRQILYLTCNSSRRPV